MRLHQGSSVTVRSAKTESNNISTAPGIVTRVLTSDDASDDTRNGPVLCNVTAFPDLSVPMLTPGIWVHDTKALADASKDPSVGWITNPLPTK